MRVNRVHEMNLLWSVGDERHESINDPGEQLMLQLSGTRYCVVFTLLGVAPVCANTPLTHR